MALTATADFLAGFDALSAGFVGNEVAALAFYLKNWLILMIGLFFLFWGIQFYHGGLTAQDVVGRMIRLIIVVLFSTNVAFYNQWISGTTRVIPGETANVMIQAADRNNLLSHDPNAAIDDAMEKSNAVAVAFWHQAQGWLPNMSWVWYLTAGVVWLFTGFVCMIAAAIVLLSKVTLDIFLAIGPLLFWTILFNGSKAVFENWVRVITGAMLVYVLAGVTISLLMHLWQFTLLSALSDPANGWPSFAIAFFVGGICVIVICTITVMAIGVTGGVAMSLLGVFGFSARQAREGGRMMGALRPHRIAQSVGRLKQDFRAMTRL